MSSGRVGGAPTPVTRVFLSFLPGVGETLDLPEDEAHHVFKVLRARDGAVVEVADSRGRLALAELRGGRARVVQELGKAGEEPEVTLYQAVPKGGRMDLVVEKATEVGVTAVVPLLTERGIVNPREGKVGRWRRVAEAAARQSLATRIPRVAEPMRFVEAARDVGGLGVLLHLGDELEPVEAVVGPGVGLFVGPEGGWSGAEIREAREAGLSLAGLGPRRLRSETAGIVGVARTRAALESRVGV